MNLNAFMNQGIIAILKTMGRYYTKSQKGRAFLADILPTIQKGVGIRKEYEKSGTHIPPFLIASIASQCNLHCTGCYARANGICNSGLGESDLGAIQWRSIFEEAMQLGIPFILLAGGEPLIRRDVIEVAARIKEIIFPVFTNGTMIDEDYLSLLDLNRNIIPVLSIEGEAHETDRRRGDGTYAKVCDVMNRLQGKGIMFGTSITVTKENIHTVIGSSFISSLQERGCGLIIFVEYVPVSEGTDSLVLNQDDLSLLEDAVSALKKNTNRMVVLSFPGDEAAMGGCLASGRGFFHINSSGGAEPCPFSPYAKNNLKTHSILEVLKSDYFAELRKIAQTEDEHRGGCTLFMKSSQVQTLLSNSQST